MIPKLYKYHKPNEFLFDLLINKTLYCASTKEFNDPHDGLYLLSNNLTNSLAQNIRPTVRQILSENNSEVNNSLDDQTIIDTAHKRFSEKEFYDLMQQNGVKLNVCSLTESGDNELMWAYYADSFKGVCLEFDFSSVPKISNVLSKVTYTNEIPTIDTISYNELKKAMTNKRQAWAHENEWRILTPAHKLKFEPLNLKTICFGPRTPKTTMNMVFQTCKCMGLAHVNFQKMKVDLNGVTFE